MEYSYQAADRIFCDDCGHEASWHVDGCTARGCTCRALVKRSQAPTPRRDIGTCKECRFMGEADFRVANQSNRAELGTCRRRAPVEHGHMDVDITAWPIVRKDWFCGEFERRDPK